MTDESKNENVTQEAPAENTATPVEGKSASENKKGDKKRAPRKASDKKPKEGVNPDFEEKVVAINRVSKVVKGGRRFSFSALMVVGDKKGKVGFGLGKAKEVPEAIRKATQTAQKNLVQVPIDQGTIPHQIVGQHDAGYILFKPAGDGTGVKAAGACRAILELAGVTNVLTKSTRGNNPHNIVKATFDALKNLRSAEQVAAVRGLDKKAVRIK